MLTFEEFFAKKKIDLVELQSADPGLFAEFSAHYPLMGEKSFDHTKKYWFNKLRRSYPLAVAAKPHAVKAEAISDLAIQGMAAAAAQNLDWHLEKPKFTEDHLPELVEENVSLKEVSLAEEEKEILSEKSGEKESDERNAEPESQRLELTTENAQPATAPVKPAFKPRFNPKNIPKAVEQSGKNEREERNNATETTSQIPEPATENPDNKPVKPAFKPRFNPKNATQPADNPPQENPPA